MDCVCNNSYCLDIIWKLLAVIVPVGIMFWTLRKERQNHLEQMKQIDEKNRIEAMPVLDLTSFSVSGWDKDDPSWVQAWLSLDNIGNGTAVNVCIECDKRYIQAVIAKGESKTFENVELSKRQEGDWLVIVHFYDLYGNEYSERISVGLQREGNSYSFIKKEISIPKLVRTKEKDEN